MWSKKYWALNLDEEELQFHAIRGLLKTPDMYWAVLDEGVFQGFIQKHVAEKFKQANQKIGLEELSLPFIYQLIDDMDKLNIVNHGEVDTTIYAIVKDEIILDVVALFNQEVE